MGPGCLAVGVPEVARICRAFIEGSLGEWHTRYICDALTLSEAVSFSSPAVEEAVESLTDPEINGRLTKETATDLIRDLTG